jgi:transposase
MSNNDYCSKKIKILRKPKFTKKKNPYKKYQLADWNWEDIFFELDLIKNEPKYFKIISEKYGINIKTLRNKFYDYEKNKIKNINEENRGGKNKDFNEQEEKEIFLFLKENFIDKNKVLCNDIIKIHANEKIKNLCPNKKFNASNGWCNMFKKRWNLSTVKISISKVATTTYTEDEIKIFLNKYKDTLVKVGENFFST